MICLRSHSKGKFSVKSMLWSLPWQKPHVSPLKDQARESLPLSTWEGLEERGNWSLEIFVEGMNNRPHSLPHRGIHPLTEPQPQQGSPRAVVGFI